MKKIIIFVLGVLPLLLHSQKNFIDMPYVEVSAKADTLVVPDKIYLSIVIDESSASQKMTLEAIEKELFQTLKKIHIDVQKNLYLVDAESYLKKYLLKNNKILTAKNYELIVHNAETAQQVLEELQAKHIGNVSIKKAEYSQVEKLLLQLKKQAMKKAEKTAMLMAEAIDQEIGKAIHISSWDNHSRAVFAEGIVVRGMSADVTQKKETIEFMKMSFDAMVNVKFQLK